MSKFIISVNYKFSVTKLRANLHSVLVKNCNGRRKDKLRVGKSRIELSKDVIDVEGKTESALSCFKETRK